MSDGDFLSRWSRRKLAAKAGRAEPEPAALPATAGNPVVPPAVEPASSLATQEGAPPPLPPVESLTPESDFSPFMQPQVDGSLRRAALKTLFQDPRFNVMDGLDVYIDDYSKPDPLPEGWLEKMNQVAHLGHHQPPPDPVEGAEAPVVAAAEPVEPVVETPPEPTTAQDSVNVESEPHSRS